MYNKERMKLFESNPAVAAAMRLTGTPYLCTRTVKGKPREELYYPEPEETMAWGYYNTVSQVNLGVYGVQAKQALTEAIAAKRSCNDAVYPLIAYVLFSGLFHTNTKLKPEIKRYRTIAPLFEAGVTTADKLAKENPQLYAELLSEVFYCNEDMLRETFETYVPTLDLSAINYELLKLSRADPVEVANHIAAKLFPHWEKSILQGSNPVSYINETIHSVVIDEYRRAKNAFLGKTTPIESDKNTDDAGTAPTHELPDPASDFVAESETRTRLLEKAGRLFARRAVDDLIILALIVLGYEPRWFICESLKDDGTCDYIAQKLFDFLGKTADGIRLDRSASTFLETIDQIADVKDPDKKAEMIDQLSTAISKKKSSAKSSLRKELKGDGKPTPRGK